MITYENDVIAAQQFNELYKKLRQEVAKVIVGQDEVVEKILISMFSKGHALLIGVPGLAKTLIITTISQSLSLSFSRIQFTPDLMPSDIIGTEILDENRQFKYIKGPIFANIILADEINRTPPKTQAALLEAMQEREVSYGGVTYPLPNPFFTLATQNPIEQEGTYPLPEAQLDRFMFSIWLDYPSFQEEVEIVKRTTLETMPTPNVISNAEEILYFQNLVRRVPITDYVVEYAVRLTARTRPQSHDAHPWAKKYLAWGAGPRSSQYLILGAKCHALLHGKHMPDQDDVRAIAVNVLQHRIVKNYKAEAEGISSRDIIQELLKE
jgi:MoxR-like ATPase